MLSANGCHRGGASKLALISALFTSLVLACPAVAQDKPSGGTMVFAHEQEPGSLNILHPSAGGGAASATGGLFNVGTYRFPPGSDPVPFIIAKEAEITSDPFTVTYTIRDEAVWNDGTPITAADYAFTYETILNPNWTISTRRPYDLITGYEILSDKKIRFDFSQPYAYYQQMFPLILPKHDLEGKDWDTAWRDGPGVTNGAFKFEAWTKGQQISFVKNEHYWAGEPGLDRIVIRFVPETNTLLELLRSGEIDASDPQPQPQIIGAVANLDGMKVNARSGLVTEFMRFNVKVPGLDKPYVRKAIAKGIDRVALVETLMGPIDPNAKPTQSLFYAPDSPYYKPNYAGLDYDPAGAIALLEENGCARGADSIFVCDGVRLEYKYLSTSGNERRELTFEIIQAFLSEIGIKLNADFAPAAIQFGTRLPAGDYEILSHGGPLNDANEILNTYGCDAAANTTGHCNREADALALEALKTPDPAARAELMNQYEALFAEDAALIPYFGLPRMVVYNSNKVEGFNVSPAQDGTVSIGGWYWNWNAHEFHRVN
jgi:peptide/nickel transport system substrate-binding protein